MIETLEDEEIDVIRASSRTIVRELGFMSKELAGTKLSPSAVHSIIEIGIGSVKNASELGALLGLEKSTVSRLLAKLIEKNLVVSKTDCTDTRQKTLTLTPRGRKELHMIESYARAQVREALRNVSLKARDKISKGLAAYAQALNNNHNRQVPEQIEIRSGYFPALLSRIVGMHAGYYSEHYGFGKVFELKVATEMAEFLGRIEKTENRLFSAFSNERLIGSISIDGEHLGNSVAHLRWFILDEGARGHGIGKRLLSAAMEHVDQTGFAETRLWTFKGLGAARKLYEQSGFKLVEEKTGKQWGTEVIEQLFVRKAA